MIDKSKDNTLLVMDIGNTNVTIGIYNGEQLLAVSRCNTKETRTQNQYAQQLNKLLTDPKFKEIHICGSIIGSVVPSVTEQAKKALADITKSDPVVVSHATKTGINIKIMHPQTLGADLLAGAVGAIEKVGEPCIVVDLGTATTITVVDKKRNFVGGAIAPGIKASLGALVAQAELLDPDFTTAPGKVIGKDTPDCIGSGLIYGSACMIDGMCQRIEEELGYECKVIATGGFSDRVIKNCKKKIIVYDNLVLDGLRSIYIKNVKC